MIRSTAYTLKDLGTLGRVALVVLHQCHPPQEVGLGLGAQAGEARLKQVFLDAGFTRFRWATATPFNLIEARK